jgi:hypothetical protein
MSYCFLLSSHPPSFARIAVDTVILTGIGKAREEELVEL